MKKIKIHGTEVNWTQEEMLSFGRKVRAVAVSEIKKLKKGEELLFSLSGSENTVVIIKRVVEKLKQQVPILSLEQVQDGSEESDADTMMLAWDGLSDGLHPRFIEGMLAQQRIVIIDPLTAEMGEIE